MNNFDLIIFDCDGTLTDSEDINNRSLLMVLHEAGFTHYTLDYALKNWVGTTVSNILLSIQMETGRTPPDDIVARYIEKVSALQKTDLRSIAHAPELVAAAAQNYKICVASNGERRNVVASLQITGLLDYFSEDTVFTKIEVKNPKPFPDLFLYAANKMGAVPERCLVIEDSAAGVQAGVAADMTTWGYAASAHYAGKQEEILKSAGAHRVFHSLIHIKEALGL